MSLMFWLRAQNPVRNSLLMRLAPRCSASFCAYWRLWWRASSPRLERCSFHRVTLFERHHSLPLHTVCTRAADPLMTRSRPSGLRSSAPPLDIVRRSSPIDVRSHLQVSSLSIDPVQFGPMQCRAKWRVPLQPANSKSRPVILPFLA